MKIIKLQPADDGTINLIDSLVIFRPTGVHRSNGGSAGNNYGGQNLLNQPPLMLKDDREDLLRIMLSMKWLGRPNMSGFERAIGMDGSDRERATARYVAWGSWLIDEMHLVKTFVHHFIQSNHVRDDNDPEKISCSAELTSVDEYYSTLYYQAIEKMSRSVLFPTALFKLPYNTFKSSMEMLNGEWYRQLQRLRWERQKLHLQGSEMGNIFEPQTENNYYDTPEDKIVEFLNAKTIAPKDPLGYGKLGRSIFESNAKVELGTHLAHDYRLSIGTERGSMTPDLFDKPEDKWVAEWDYRSYREEEAQELQSRARHRLAKGDNRFDFLPNGRWPVNWFPIAPSDEYYNSTEEFDGLLMSGSFFALDPEGSRSENLLFFGLEIGHLERRRCSQSCSSLSPSWKSSEIPVVRKFNAKTGKTEGIFLINPLRLGRSRSYNAITIEIAQEIFPQNACARPIGLNFNCGPKKAQIAAMEGPYYTSSTLKPCGVYSVTNRLGIHDNLPDHMSHFVSCDATRPELVERIDDYYVRKEEAIVPSIRDLYHPYRGEQDSYIMEHYKELIDSPKSRKHFEELYHDRLALEAPKRRHGRRRH